MRSRVMVTMRRNGDNRPVRGRAGQPAAMLLVAAALLLVVGPLGAASAKDASARPNIIVMMADDMGYSDIGPYGGEIDTPTLDRLAGNGLRFTQFYNTARCCPTRASLLTGLYQHQTGVGHMMGDKGLAGFRGDLNEHCVTIAQVLKTAGYATYMSGKWHVTPARGGDKHNWPKQRGFDRFFGTIHGAGSFYDPNTLTRGNEYIPPHEAGPQYTNDNFYYTDAISTNAARFVRDHAEQKGDRPFFMYVAYTAPHWPMQAPEETVEKYKGEYDVGWDTIRAQRYRRMKQMGLIRDHWDLSKRDPRAPAWEDANHKAWNARCMAVYAAMVDRMDQGIGRIVKTLEQTGELENTLILFLADNGGCAEGMGRGGSFTPRPDEPVNPMGRDELQHRMVPKFTRDGYPVRQGPGVMPGPPDTYIAYGRPWANVSNTPFREYKHWVHEGGIASPLIAHWPGRIDREGELERQPAHLIDIMATCVDLAGATYPDSRDGHEIHPMEGVSLAPALTGEPLGREQPLFFEHEGNRALRDGKWKLVAKGDTSPWELYDLAADRSETNNLAEKHPERVQAMASKWEKMAKRVNAVPWPWKGEYGSAIGADAKHFKLKAGAKLPRHKAPAVEGKALSITVKLKRLAEDGVLVAQGGGTDGYALYVKDGKLRFATRRSGKLAEVVAPQPLSGGVLSVSVELADNGRVTLKADGDLIARGKTPGPLTSMPIDGLQVGRDENGAVGKYGAPFPFGGKVERVTIDLGE